MLCLGIYVFTTIPVEEANARWATLFSAEGVESQALAALLPLTTPMELGGRSRDVLLVGKRKPFLNSELDAARIRKHVLKFEEMVTTFRGDPGLDPA